MIIRVTVLLPSSKLAYSMTVHNKKWLTDNSVRCKRLKTEVYIFFLPIIRIGS